MKIPQIRSRYIPLVVKLIPTAMLSYGMNHRAEVEFQKEDKKAL